MGKLDFCWKYIKLVKVLISNQNSSRSFYIGTWVWVKSNFCIFHILEILLPTKTQAGTNEKLIITKKLNFKLKIKKMWPMKLGQKSSGGPQSTVMSVLSIIFFHDQARLNFTPPRVVLHFLEYSRIFQNFNGFKCLPIFLE